jgi:hypothetical protein
MRVLLEDYARSRQMDPLIAENWYPIRYKQIINFPVLRGRIWRDM